MRCCRSSTGSPRSPKNCVLDVSGSHPFERLTPDFVLQAVEAQDGERLLDTFSRAKQARDAFAALLAERGQDPAQG